MEEKKVREELKKCPFCGGESEIVEDKKSCSKLQAANKRIVRSK